MSAIISNPPKRFFSASAMQWFACSPVATRSEHLLDSVRSGIDEAQKQVLEHPEEFSVAAHRFFERHFVWDPGEYNMKVVVQSDINSANLEQHYRFTIFESHTATLCAIREYFKYGGGLWWYPDLQTSVILEVKDA